MSEWEYIQLGEMVRLKRGHDLPISEMIDGKFSVYGSSGVIGYHNEFTTRGPGVVIGRSGNSVGRAHFSESDFWAHNTTLYVEKFFNTDPRFMYYFFQKYNLARFEGGSAIPTLNRNHIHLLEFLVPPSISEQKAIAEILSILDQKITLLHHQNQTLEKIAQTLFKQWFIDFEFPCLPSDYVLGAGKPSLPYGAGKPSLPYGAGEPGIEELNKTCTYRAVGGLPAPQPGKHFIYVLLCKNESFYIGLTDELYRRWHEHKTGSGAKWTKAHPPVKVIHYEEFTSRAEAAEREKWLKTGFGRKWLKREFKANRLRQAGKMVASEFGETPEGWRVDSMLEFCDLLSGGTPKTDIQEYWDGEIKWLSAKDIANNNGVFILNSEKKITADGLNESATKLLPENTTVITARGTVGCYSIIPEKMCISQSNYGLKAKHPNQDYFTYLFVGYLISRMQAHAYGSVFDTITTSTFKQLQVILPHEKIITQFENIVRPFFRKIHLNSHEIISLTKTRDTLLPKLMSGQIRIKDFEKEVSD